MYEPNPFSGRPEDIANYLLGELYRISDALRNLQIDEVSFTIRHSEPDKPRLGYVYVADGADWNPGYGEGPYYYNGVEFLPLVTPPDTEKVPTKKLRLISYAPKFDNSTVLFKPAFNPLRFTTYAPVYTDTSCTAEFQSSIVGTGVAGCMEVD